MSVGEKTYTFPPFPDPPEGVAIMPFSTFSPSGYRCESSIEVDAWAGIPTVKVLNEEEAAKRRKAKRRRRNAGNATDAQGRLIPWWEEWEAGEASRTMSVTLDSQVSLEDRVCVAADDFRVGRTWPEIAHGVRNMWDQFRLYIGLISSIPVYKRIKAGRRGQVDGPNNGEDASDEEEDMPKAEQTKVAIAQDYFEQSPLPGKQLEPSSDKTTVEAQRLRVFVDDMEKSIKVFLSSYMRDTGLIWTERNLFIAPTILHFFLRFMLRNGVFSDTKEHRENLENALSIAALAQKELPLTAKLGQMLPGHFDLACRECWGTQGSMNIHISATLESADTASTNSPNDLSCEFETELKNQDIEIVPSGIVLDSITARQAMEDNLDTDHGVPVTTIPVAGDPWTAAIQAEEYTTESWTDVSIPWLMQLLGPTTFPMTMMTGIVEHSTRRIRDVLGPGANPDRSETRKVSVVEEALGERFFRVVLTPWVGSASEETADFPRPAIVPGSKGAIVPEGLDVGGEDMWNSYHDEVTILVDEVVAKQLIVGMGLCGTWVQMVPGEEEKGHPRGCYWYVESVVATVPSYYTEGEMIVGLAGEAEAEDEDVVV